MRPLDDTIVALATPAAGAARGVVRLSGPLALRCLASCRADADASAAALPAAADESPPRPRVENGDLRLAGCSAPLPAECWLWPSGRSYTGQCLVEIHTCGSPPLLAALVEQCVRGGARLAEPGEFTLRAFLTGKIDLTQAEAVLGVIEAESEGQLDAALAQLAGGMAAPLQSLRNDLLDLLADLEAGMDFGDEDLRFIAPEETQRRIAAAQATVRKLAAQCASRDRGGPRPRVVLCGRPNVGKSSLFNALCGAARALTADRPGTTRDFLSAELDLDGVHCELIDTAGVMRLPDRREPRRAETSGGETSSPAVQAEAMTTGQLGAAALRIICRDAAEDVRRPEPGGDDDLAQWRALGADEATPTLHVWTKCDRAPRVRSPDDALATSAKDGAGIESLRRAIRAALLAGQAGGADVVASTALRARESLAAAEAALDRAAHLAAAAAWEELIAAELRLALDELGRVVGAVYTDDLLDRVFSRFCIGK